jgi:hypothetical protein
VSAPVDPVSVAREQAGAAARFGSGFLAEQEAAPQASRFDPFDTGQTIMSELVKSYGFKYDTAGGGWSWSLENIAESFEEDPIWTSLDYLLLAVPVAKWGTAAYKVSELSKGTSATKRLYQTGALAEPAAVARAGEKVVHDTWRGAAVDKVGRAFGAAPGFGRAVEMEVKHGLPRTSAGWSLSSHVARRGLDPDVPAGLKPEMIHAGFAGKKLDDPEYAAMLEAGGIDPIEMRGLHAPWARERAMELDAYDRMAKDLGNELRTGLKTEDERTRFANALRGGVTPENLTGFEPPARALYEKTWKWRLDVHQSLYDAKLISEEAYEAGLKTYFPRVWKEWQSLNPTNSLKRRTLSEGDAAYMAEMELMTQILDPTVAVNKMGRAAMKLAHHNYFMRLGTSAGARSADDVINHLLDVFHGAPEADDAIKRATRGAYDEGQINDFFSVLRADAAATQRRTMETVGANVPKVADDTAMFPARELTFDLANVSSETKDRALRAIGWKPLDDYLTSMKVPGYLERLPEELRGLYIDPAMGQDIEGMVRMGEEWGKLGDVMARVYQGSLGTFKFSKTVTNPATHLRNLIGATIFHHLTVGGTGILNPNNPFFKAGRAALEAGPESQDFMEALRAGMIGSSHDRELARHIANALGKAGETGGDVTDLLAKLPGIQDSWVLEGGVKGLSRLERAYRWVDEVAKVDAFVTRRDAWIKKLTKEGFEGDLRAEAITRAAGEIAKYQPMFAQTSPFTNLARNAIPFASFTTEAVRVWKNAMVDKPHLVFFYNHMAESLSQVTGAMAGFTPQEIDEAKKALPHYMQGKKTMVWPWRVDGKPVFLDMSYMIPMANISESAAAEGTFFDLLQIDPFTNPMLSMAAAAKTGVDPFSGQPIEPRFAERQLGIQMEPGRLRKTVGLIEHGAKLMLPPLVPPGYSGVNLMEWARGTRHPISGQELEQGAARTLAANVGGLRLYEADVQSQLLNLKRDERLLEERSASWWDKWRFAAANGDANTMATAVRELEAIRLEQGHTPEEAAKYIQKGIETREPGKYRTLTTKQLKEVVKRSEAIGYTDPQDRAALGEIMARLQERNTRSRSKKPPKEKK